MPEFRPLENPTFSTESAVFCRSRPPSVLVKSDANDWSSRKQMGGQVHAIKHLTKDCSPGPSSGHRLWHQKGPPPRGPGLDN